MDKDQLKNVVSGVLVVDKPIGLTSHDVVQVIRRGTGIRRAGHTGTLDPRASGVLVVLVGPAVRLSEYVSASDKRYQATIQLGSSTDTYDLEGTITDTSSVEDLDEDQFNEILMRFVGEIEQVPPPYSAVKVKGRKAYEMARKGEEVELRTTQDPGLQPGPARVGSTGSRHRRLLLIAARTFGRWQTISAVPWGPARI